MEKCSPVEMRKNLEAVEQLKKHGIDFVPIPVIDDEHKKELIEQSMSVFEKIGQ